MTVDQSAMRAADELTRIANEVGEITKVLVSMNEKLDRIVREGDGPAPGVSKSGTFT
jgi:hypothetical protein